MDFRPTLIFIIVISYVFPSPAYSQENDYTLTSESTYAIKSFRKAKKYLLDIYNDNKQTFYCACEFNAKKKINSANCGYTARKDAKRGSRLEWEHVVPASRFGRPLQCWQQPEQFERCVKKNGKTVSGRKCCRRVNPTFRAMEADMMNLVPSVGELNGDRRNYKFGTVKGEKRIYGACDFEINRKKRMVEPNVNIRGDVARIYFYMQKKYGMKLSRDEISQFSKWAENDPANDWELEKNQRVNGLLQALEQEQLQKRRFAADE